MANVLPRLPNWRGFHFIQYPDWSRGQPFAVFLDGLPLDLNPLLIRKKSLPLRMAATSCERNR